MDVNRAALSGGAALAPYLHAFSVDLFRPSTRTTSRAPAGGIGAAILYDHAGNADEDIEDIDRLHGDARRCSPATELIYQEQGLEAFERNEAEKALNLWRRDRSPVSSRVSPRYSARPLRGACPYVRHW